jgi:hypothetical protein
VTELPIAKKYTLPLVNILLVILMAWPAQAQQQSKTVAVNLIREAMTAYGNLDVDTAKAKLDAALAMGAQLDSGTLARVHMSYGILWIGGLGDNARGQDSFVTGRCLDPSAQIDPLYSTPEIEMIFTLAKGQVNPSACQQRGAVPAAMPPTTVMPGPQQPVQPMPQPMPQPTGAAWGAMPACGSHSPVSVQSKSHELPLAVQIDQGLATRITRLGIRYAFDGSTTFFNTEMNKAGSGWATGMITCTDGQIANFDPSRIAYFIEGYDASGVLVCSNGTAEAPFTVSMTQGAAVMQGLPGTPEPQKCGECPPWDQKCMERPKAESMPCFADEECPTGQKCGDSGFCEGGEDKDKGKGRRGSDGEGGGPQFFYVNITGGTGGGFATSKDPFLAAEGWDQGVYSAEYKKISAGAWGGVPLRFQLGFPIKPRFALEVGMRIDFRALTTKMKQPYPCKDTGPYAWSELRDEYGLQCGASTNDEHYGALNWEEGGWLYAFTRDFAAPGFGKAFLINMRARYKFVLEEKIQVSFFGGLGYGHLFYAPKTKDVDMDGKRDVQFSTPGMINLELGPALSIYLNRNFGFVFEVPIDLVFGQAGSFGLNAELAVGISFGG